MPRRAFSPAAGQSRDRRGRRRATGSTNSATSVVGNLGNTNSGAWQSSILALQDAQNEQNAIYSLQINQQASQFNNMMDEKSEMMRESNALRDVALEQKKADTQVMKKFIESII